MPSFIKECDAFIHLYVISYHFHQPIHTVMLCVLGLTVFLWTRTPPMPTGWESLFNQGAALVALQYTYPTLQSTHSFDTIFIHSCGHYVFSYIKRSVLSFNSVLSSLVLFIQQFINGKILFKSMSLNIIFHGII